jgi:hypothetical protein
MVYDLSDISVRDFEMAKMFLESCRKADLLIVTLYLLEDLILSCERFESLCYFERAMNLTKINI